MEQAHSRVRMTTLLADAGYDAEWIHVAARYAFQTRTLIPPKHGRPTTKLPRQYYRRRMARIFANKQKRKPYRQRSQVETVFSVVKRRLDSSVNAHGYWSQCRALRLKALTHNILLLRRKQVFDRASWTPFRRDSIDPHHETHGVPATRPWREARTKSPPSMTRRDVGGEGVLLSKTTSPKSR
jgi:hypothetical protein